MSTGRNACRFQGASRRSPHLAQRALLEYQAILAKDDLTGAEASPESAGIEPTESVEVEGAPGPDISEIVGPDAVPADAPPCEIMTRPSLLDQIGNVGLLPDPYASPLGVEWDRPVER